MRVLETLLFQITVAYFARVTAESERCETGPCGQASAFVNKAPDCEVTKYWTGNGTTICVKRCRPVNTSCTQNTTRSTNPNGVFVICECTPGCNQSSTELCVETRNTSSPVPNTVSSPCTNTNLTTLPISEETTSVSIRAKVAAGNQIDVYIVAPVASVVGSIAIISAVLALISLRIKCHRHQSGKDTPEARNGLDDVNPDLNCSARTDSGSTGSASSSPVLYTNTPRPRYICLNPDLSGEVNIYHDTAETASGSLVSTSPHSILYANTAQPHYVNVNPEYRNEVNAYQEPAWTVSRWQGSTSPRAVLYANTS